MRTPSGVVRGRTTRLLGSALILSALIVGLLPLVAAAAADNPNDVEYWEAQYPNAVKCYKYDPPTQLNFHGRLADKGKAVVLYPFQDNWPGDRWEVLIVKSGNEPGNTGLEARRYELPTAHTKYYGPLNGGGQQGEVSHWIVCKGKTPRPRPRPPRRRPRPPRRLRGDDDHDPGHDDGPRPRRRPPRRQRPRPRRRRPRPRRQRPRPRRRRPRPRRQRPRPRRQRPLESRQPATSAT